MKRKLRGRPPKFATPEDLKKVLTDYFENTPAKEYTISGLALAVGSRQLLHDYHTRKGFEHLVTEAKLMVELAYEKALLRSNCTGAIFALKNMGWTDKRDIEYSGEVKGGGNQILILRSDEKAHLENKTQSVSR